MELLNRVKAQRAESIGCRKTLSKIIRRDENLPNLEKIVIKFFLNFIFKLDKIYFLTSDTLSAALYFHYIYF